MNNDVILKVASLLDSLGEEGEICISPGNHGFSLRLTIRTKRIVEDRQEAVSSEFYLNLKDLRSCPDPDTFFLHYLDRVSEAFRNII